MQERKVAEKVRRAARLDGNAHEMARYDKGSNLLNLLISKKNDREHAPQQVSHVLHGACCPWDQSSLHSSCTLCGVQKSVQHRH